MYFPKDAPIVQQALLMCQKMKKSHRRDVGLVTAREGGGSLRTIVGNTPLSCQ